MSTEQNIKIKLPTPHPAQKKILESNARYKILQCGRRFGKSLICQYIAVMDMLNNKKVGYITPEYGLAKDFFKEIDSLIPADLVKTKNQSELLIELKTGGSIKFFSGEAIENMRGRKFHRVIVDEAAFVSDLESAWTRTIRPTLTDYKGGAIFISTPKGKGYFDALFLKGKNKENDWETFHFTSYDNPHISKKEIDAARLELSEAVFNQEYLAIAGEDANNPFGINNVRKNIISTFSTLTTAAYGIDVARVHDWTVIIGLDEQGSMTHFERFKAPWERVKDRIAQLPPDIAKVIDATGVGDVLFEDLLMIGVQNLYPFKFNAESKPKLVYELVKDVEQGTVKYNETTANEMAVFEYKRSFSGHVRFEAASGFHDDCVMALALANRYRKEFKKITNWKLFST